MKMIKTCESFAAVPVPPVTWIEFANVLKLSAFELDTDQELWYLGLGKSLTLKAEVKEAYCKMWRNGVELGVYKTTDELRAAILTETRDNKLNELVFSPVLYGIKVNFGKRILNMLMVWTTGQPGKHSARMLY